ncbi:16S rRNA (uracil(1498)-N(3))-methyltransferase [Bacillus sp. M6-12]|uniref:16S rRNA (uracil(1498)-N(3))-methyltransferase n=1 Tax=Bacillus sp. M6-12 TaxID=2054166 RepID=UPI000C7791B4|nr:16S rRNA (uracil(1498)-N(3))-methyltransferase [Bacillus sp. M6-12]PLS15181.1 16S rRNA (uracil(1498)-N(3))-methyltransferase [Bacillus sp. M6-12]
MQRYFLSDDGLNGAEVKVSGEDFHHIVRVMRMSEGDRIICVARDGRTALTEITEVSNEMIRGTVIEWYFEEKELPVKVAIASGLPKGDKLEYIIQKGTELGAHEFIPFIAARSVVKWDSKKSVKKTERLQKIAKEAAEQSHRNTLPSVNEPMSLKELIAASAAYDYKLAAFEESAKQGESSVLAAVLKNAEPGQSILFVFGPEGGLASGEVDQLIQAGFSPCGLGPRILRTETAPLYALAAVSYQLELTR